MLLGVGPDFVLPRVITLGIKRVRGGISRGESMDAVGRTTDGIERGIADCSASIPTGGALCAALIEATRWVTVCVVLVAGR